MKAIRTAALVTLGFFALLVPTFANAPSDDPRSIYTGSGYVRSIEAAPTAFARHRPRVSRRAPASQERGDNLRGLVEVPTGCLPAHLKAELAAIRRIAGRAVVVSAHRPGAMFESGGATYRSAHADCRAMDVVVPDSKRPAVLSYLNAHRLGCVITHCKGCGPIPEHIHVDDMANYCPAHPVEAMIDKWTGKTVPSSKLAENKPKPKEEKPTPAPAPMKLNALPKGIMYGFQGINGIFDEKAFKEFARNHGYVPHVIGAWQVAAAVREFERQDRRVHGYALYGYSLGAQTAATVVARGAEPAEVFTVGAYRTNEMASLRRMPAGTWHNYPDASSGDGKAAFLAGGGFRLKVAHYEIQKELNDRTRSTVAGISAAPPTPRGRPLMIFGPTLSAAEVAEIEAQTKPAAYERTGPFMVPAVAMTTLPPIRPEDAKRIFSRNSDDEYLWNVYLRTPRKVDNTGDFTWKDRKAAAMAHMTLPQWVIGGVSARMKRAMAAAGRAMDQAGIKWAILSAYRDDYRQAIAEGYKAATGYSLHGGSKRTCGYGCGMAIDVCEAAQNPADADCERVAGWIARHGAKYGLRRPMPGIDPFHIQLSDLSSPRPRQARHAIVQRHRRIATR